MKTCATCKQEKPENKFHKCKNTKDGLRSDCSSCRNEYLKKWANDNRDKRRAQKYRHLYGIDLNDYEQHLAIQGGRCAICRTDTPGRGQEHFLVDHDHETGKVRGLLCHSCNAGIGMLKHDIRIVQRAFNYLNNIHTYDGPFIHKDLLMRRPMN